MYYRALFRETNTELSPHVLASGTADEAINVLLRGGKICKRAGFKSLDGNTTNVVRMIQGPDGSIYTRTAAGWFYIWANRVYFNCAAGSYFGGLTGATGTKKAGLPRPAALTAAVAGGVAAAKEGEYRIYQALGNMATGEESVVSLPQHTYAPLACRASAGAGAITASAIAAAASYADYDFDKVKVYCSSGRSERMINPVVSMVGYLEAQVAQGSGSVGLGWPDFLHGTRSHPAFTNHGGEPPASTVGVFDGLQAVYCLADGKVEFSIPRMPTAVPRLEAYTDSDTGWSFSCYLEPRPWRGYIDRCLPGAAVAAAYGGGRILIFTAGETVQMRREPGSGRLYPTVLDSIRGCPAAQGAISTGTRVHALSYGAWLVAGPDGLRNTAEFHWTPTLRNFTTPADSVAAFYSHHNQVWVTDGATPSKIYVLDATTGYLQSRFDVTGIGKIRAMCEYCAAGSSPVMRLATSTGLWEYDPNGTQVKDGATDFASSWQGYFGTERVAYDQTLNRLVLHIGQNAKAGGAGTGTLTINCTGLKTGGGTSSTKTNTMVGPGRYIQGAEFDPYLDGNLFRVKISAAANDVDSWRLDDLFLSLGAQLR